MPSWPPPDRGVGLSITLATRTGRVAFPRFFILPEGHIGFTLSRGYLPDAMASSDSHGGEENAVDSADCGQASAAAIAAAGQEILEEENIKPSLVSAGTAYDGYP